MMNDTSLLTEAIRLMLAEADAQVGAALEAEETAARAAFEKAEADLERWDAENAKKAALLAKADALGVKLGDNKATRELKQQPQFNYDPKVLQAKRETLVAKFERAREEYGAYEPSATGYKRVSAAQGRAPADMQKPEPGARVYMPITQVKPLRWYQWNDSKWARAVKKVPYGSAGDRTGDEQSGTGPGEERLALIFGGRVQGGRVSFDVVTPDDRRWEVKALDTVSTLIRPGTEGRAAMERPRKRMEAVIKQLLNFVTVSRKVGYRTLAADPAELSILEFVEDFTRDEAPMIMKGEMPPERVRALRAVIKSLQELRRRWELGEARDVDTTVGLAKRSIEVDKATFIDVAKRVQRAQPDLDVLDSFAEHELVLSTLRDSAFQRPSDFFNTWFDSVDVNRVFAQVDGVFIVNQQGFNMVPRPLFKRAFRFIKVTQGFPRFQFTYYNGTPTGDK